MGRPSDLKSSSSKSSNLPPYRDDPPQSSAASAHSLQPYDYAAETLDGLPAYRDEPSSPTEQVDFLQKPTYEIPGGREYSTRAGCTIITLDPSLSKDAQSLHALVLKQSHLPPKPVVNVTGTHSESSTDRNGKKTSNTVTDFNFRIEPGETLLRPSRVQVAIQEGSITPGMTPIASEEEQLRKFRKLIVVEDGDKAFRGGRMKAKAPGWKALPPSATDIEGGDAETNPAAPHLGEWCRRFCEDPAGTKTFTFKRYITDWNTETITSAFNSYIRGVNYRGNISVHYTTNERGFTVYSPSLFNRLRTNNFVWWACVILQLWIITWPLLWLLTRRYEVVSCQWPYSQNLEEGNHNSRRVYATAMSEDEWAHMWKLAVEKAAFGRRQNGEWITTRDIKIAHQAQLEEAQRGQDTREAREQTRKGSGFMNAVVGIAEGLGQASAAYNRHVGWGADQD